MADPTTAIQDPPETFPREPFVAASCIQRKVLRAELAEIKESRKRRGVDPNQIDHALTSQQEDPTSEGEPEATCESVPEEADEPGRGSTFAKLLVRLTLHLRAGFRTVPEVWRATRFGLKKTAIWFLLHSPFGQRFARWQKAREWKEQRRRAWDDQPVPPPYCADLVGLALSGGGIRSATVSLGVLQKLASAGVLRLVDYLSTVSGGGYIGCSWSATLSGSGESRPVPEPSGNPTEQGKTESSGLHVNSPPDFPFIFTQASASAETAQPSGVVSGAARWGRRANLRQDDDPERDEAGAAFEEERRRRGQEPVALVHVRDFANYLVPRGLRDQVRVPVLLLRGIIVNVVLMLPAFFLLSAVALAAYGYPLRLYPMNEMPGFVVTPWVAGICLSYLILATCIQTWRPTFAKATWLRTGGTNLVDKLVGWPEPGGWGVRRNLLAVGTVLLTLLVLAAGFEASQYLFAWAARAERNGAGSIMLREELWGAAAAVAAVLSAFAGQATGSGSSRVRAAVFAALAILIPLGLILAYLAFAAHSLISLAIQNQRPFGFMEPLQLDLYEWAVLYALAGLAVFLLNFLWVDINKTSLHNYYRDRLSRAFVFKLSKEDAPDPWTKEPKPVWRTEHEDELQLQRIRPSQTGGPYHLINAIVNSPDFGDDNRIGSERQRGRRADFFVFSPCHCGNERLGYCRTSELEKVDPHMNLATAMAISAAAAAPNMGQKTFNPFLVFLMSILNVRLGYWLRQPQAVEDAPWIKWPVGPIYFLLELIGLSWRSRTYINLTDGGHLDNTGVFELLRRRCRYIIAVDAEADPQMSFNGLATVQRLARIDLGVKIDFDVEDLRPDADGLCRRHFALCNITYERDVDQEPKTGKLLYIKSSVTGTEIEYVKEYRRRNPTFPHETTGDQFFDEAQFEAYRALGAKMGHELVERITDADVAAAAAFFGHLENWLQPVMPLEKGLADLVNRRRSIDERLRVDGLAEYRNEIWPPHNGAEKPGLPEGAAPFACPGESLWQPGETPKPQILLLVNEQIQLMELALLQLRLDDPTNWQHPRNRGWQEMFVRWSDAPTFRKYWQLAIPYYSHGLEAFGVNVLKLPQPLQQRPEAA